MIRPGALQNCQIFFKRHDPQGEAQELLQEMRPMGAPQPRKRGMAEEAARGDADVAAPAASLLLAGPGLPSHAANAADQRMRARLLAEECKMRNIPATAEVLQPQSPRAPGQALTPRRQRGGNTISRYARFATAADMQLRHPAANFQEVPDYRRKNIFRLEQLKDEGRWPDQALWAGHGPEFIKERFDRLGTLTNERGDGRTLPHERGEKFYLN
eukprot:TRINITY_DN20399_c0_g1_i1.p1 TRINITY_DN20399_c0_g1~~TRINITY_DN20399_c0_g1_i1.p1  ORF type:complete len:214 (+),score=36.94 TRINITY_DN20399_c0_g1_i1:34-675(+)